MSPTPTATATIEPIRTVVADPAQPVQVTSNNGALTLRLPPKSVAPDGQAVPFELSVEPATPVVPVGAVPPLKTIEIRITTLDGQNVTQLAQPLEIEFAFTPEELAQASVDPSLLAIYYSNDGITWHALDTTIDHATGTARATVDHLTIFSLRPMFRYRLLLFANDAPWRSPR